MGGDLLDLEEVRQRRLPLGFHPGQIHGNREVVDEATVHVQDQGFAEGRDEDVADFLLRVPALDVVGQGYPEERVQLKDLRKPMEQYGSFRGVQDGWVAFLEGAFVLLRMEQSNLCKFENIEQVQMTYINQSLKGGHVGVLTVDDGRYDVPPLELLLGHSGRCRRQSHRNGAPFDVFRFRSGTSSHRKTVQGQLQGVFVRLQDFVHGELSTIELAANAAEE